MEEGEFEGGTEDPSCLEGSPSETYMAPSGPLAVELAALVGRAAPLVQIPWIEEPQVRQSVFETLVSALQPYKPLPGLPDFVEELQSSWGSPASAPTCSRPVEALYALQGMEKLGLQHFPPVDSSVAAIVQTPTISRLSCDFSCPNKQCRVTEMYFKRAYSAGLLAARLANTAGLLTMYQSQLLQDLSAQLSQIINELRLVNDHLLRVVWHSGQAIGRNLGALVVA
ncbi:UNVERIFIED_CONTAM: hypothetical protein FKN15_065660 [Acipenser sinensis]